MRKFTKKSDVVEAIQITDEFFSGECSIRPHIQGVIYYPQKKIMVIPTQEGQITAKPGDWIIKGTDGKFYPCGEDLFDDSYEEFSEGKLKKYERVAEATIKLQDFCRGTGYDRHDCACSECWAAQDELEYALEDIEEYRNE